MSGLGNQGAYDLRLVKDVLAEKDAKVQRLKALIIELAEWCSQDPESITDHGREILQRAREATK
jgi:hypothetical protein